MWETPVAEWVLRWFRGLVPMCSSAGRVCASVVTGVGATSCRVGAALVSQVLVQRVLVLVHVLAVLAVLVCMGGDGNAVGGAHSFLCGEGRGSVPLSPTRLHMVMLRFVAWLVPCWCVEEPSPLLRGYGLWNVV